MAIAHAPVMVAAILDGLQVASRADAVYVDGTVGAGGHSGAILAARSDSRLIGMDLDLQALDLAREALAPFGERVRLIHASYTAMPSALAEAFQVSQADGILLDLGVSSMQLDEAVRGFAFRLEGPLDMRFDSTSEGQTAADLTNTLPADALADILYHYGEERHSRRIARAIVAARPLHTTRDLAELIAGLGLSHGKIHPATRTFQALRIAVNDELRTVETALPVALGCLKPGGRLAVISFHSLEDRIVKQYFKQEAADCLCPPHQPVCTCNHRARVKLITRKPITAPLEEIERNPRARSAKLRVVERLESN
ncbi:MAG: 16S rRNA (cytosine(1402)-N(4))-methyltransferase RsmH [Chloroflexi bacterium]|nr:16S rRNA (cytosine(1402)-N(4))-methyltransferase RsmH [Chloroflexota bacterium]